MYFHLNSSETVHFNEQSEVSLFYFRLDVELENALIFQKIF